MHPTFTASRWSRAARRLAVLVPLSPALAQEPLYTFTGTSPFDVFGESTDAGGDADGDGVPDLVVGGHRANGFAGVCRVYSGADGSLLHDTVGMPSEVLGGFVAFVGDVDADGRDDYAASGSPGVSVFSGLSGARMLGPLAGGEFAGPGDLDGDGHDDLLVDDSFGSGATTLYSGASGLPLQTFSDRRLPRAAGDLNHDGAEDFLLVDGDQRIHAHSGVDAALLYSVPFPDAEGTLSALAGVGDVDADGTDDLAALDQNIGMLYVLSGVDGSLAGLLEPVVECIAPDPLSSAGDVDLDGHDDLLVTGRVYSGRTGSVLFETPAPPGIPCGAACPADVDGDGLPEIFVGVPFAASESIGEARVYRATGHVGSSYCTATPNSTGVAAEIRAGGTASVSENDLVLMTDFVPAGQPGIYFYGSGQTLLAFGNGFLCVAGRAAGLQRLPVTFASPAGHLTFALDNTAPPTVAGTILPGSTWNFQAWFRDPAAGGSSFNLSDGLQVQFQP